MEAGDRGVWNKERINYSTVSFFCTGKGQRNFFLKRVIFSFSETMFVVSLLILEGVKL